MIITDPKYLRKIPNLTCFPIYGIIILMKKFLDSDRLRAVQFKCNTSANYTSQFWIIIGWRTIGHLLSQWCHVKWWRKSGFKKDLPALPSKFFMFILLSNHTVFLVQFGINLHWWDFSQSEGANAISASRHCIIFFLNNPSLTFLWFTVSSLSQHLSPSKMTSQATSQTNSARSPCNPAMNDSETCFSNFKNSKNIEEKSYDHNTPYSKMPAILVFFCLLPN